MIINITNPQGIDYLIAKLQTWLQAELFKKWGIDSGDPLESAKFLFYPRIYRNRDRDRGSIAELYLGDGEYREVYYDDTLKGLSWFGLGSRYTNDVDTRADIHLVTFADLSALYPAIAHRADNEIRMDFEEVFASPIFGFTLDSTEIGLSNVLREYPGSLREDRLIAADMGKIHAFRLNLKLAFSSLETCNL